jgi:methionyl-tRNA formyltransferase
MALRVVFFGNSNSVFSLLHFQALLKEKIELVCVVDSPRNKRGSTNPLSPGFQGLRQALRGTETSIVEPESPNEAAFVNDLARKSPDLFVSVGYTNILKEAILSLPRLFAVNFHASLLPQYRGKHPIFWCLRNGERRSGLTVHVMDPGIDTGDILYQVHVRVFKQDTIERLYDRIIARSLPLISRLIQECRLGTIKFSPQPPEQGSYFSSISDEDFRILWSGKAETIRRWITITPGRCYADIGGYRLNFKSASVVRTDDSPPPGTILYLGSRRGVVAALDGGVSLNRVQCESLQAASFAECLRQLGYRAGDILGETLN